MKAIIAAAVCIIAARWKEPSHWPTTGPAEIPPHMPELRYPSACALRSMPASSTTHAAAPVYRNASPMP